MNRSTEPVPPAPHRGGSGDCKNCKKTNKQTPNERNNKRSWVLDSTIKGIVIVFYNK